MIFVLLEQENNVIAPMIPKLTASINKSCVKYIQNKVKVDQILCYKELPLFERGWFLVYSGIDKSVIKFLCSLDTSTVVLKQVSKSKCEATIALLKSLKLDYKFIDNWEIKKQTKIDYILREISVDNKDAEYLYNRTRGYTKAIVEGVSALKTLNNITREDIRALVPKSDRYGLLDLYKYLILSPDCTMGYSDAVLIIYRYRYGFQYVKDFLLGNLTTAMEVYGYIASGELTITNYREVHAKLITTITEYQVYKIIEQYNRVSYEYLYFLYTSISKLSKGDTGIYMLLNILRVRKGKD
jgi:hypothetical protein